MSEAVMPADTAAPEVKAKKRPGRLFLMLIVPLLLAAVGGYFYLTSGRYVSTDNAYVQQDKVSVSAEVNGPIVEVAVRENQRVKKGDLLFRIDPTPFRIALEEAEAQIAAAEVQVQQLETRTVGTGADIRGAQANLSYAQANFTRYSELLDRGFTTRARYDEALHDVQEAQERLANARAEAANAQSALRGGGTSNQPAVEAARVARERALLNLKRTEVHAPADGIVTGADRMQVGNAVVSGAPMVTIVRSDAVWIEANYKETDLANMIVGQHAEVELDAYPGTKVEGHVASIGAGTGSESSVLPAQNATGNWVKVTQRVPVRIAIDNRPDRQLIAGLSAEVKVDTEAAPEAGPRTQAR
jgi:membrane fusion protein, multidrug efflux system